MTPKDWVLTLVACTVLVASVAGALEYFAKDTDLTELAMDFQQERLFNRVDRLEERMWTIRNAYPQEMSTTQWRQCDQEEYRKLEQELRRAKEGMYTK